MARVFISYRHVRPDEDIARALHRRLSDLDHDVFLDAADIPIGAPWDKEIKENIRRAEWFVALVSAAYLYSDYIVNTELALASQRLADGSLDGIVPINVAFAGDYPDKISKLLGDIQQAKWRSAADIAPVVNGVVERIPRPQVLIKGMRAFQPTDAPRFPSLGREADVERFLAALAGAKGILLLHGVSGSGKSSFLNAGVLPRLAEGAVELRRADAADPPAFPPPAEGTTWVIIDQLEQWLVPFGKKPDEAARFGREVLAWLAGSGDRRVILSIRDEYRTPFDAILGELAGRATAFALLPFDPPTAAGVLRLLLEDARVDHDPTFVDELCVELSAGTPPAVRPALLQLIAQETRHFGRRLDRAGWSRAARGERSFFEAHLRRTVFDPLPPRISRVGAAAALRGLTAGELKSSPRTAADIAADEKLPPAVVRRTLDMAALPHARVVAGEETPSGAPRYQLVHDLFAAAAVAVHRDEQRARQLWVRRAVITALSLLLAASATLGVVAVVRGRQTESALLAANEQRRVADARRAEAELQTRRALSSSLAALAQSSLSEDPPRSLLYAVEGVRRAPPGEGWQAERALRTTLGESGGIHLPASPSATLALSSNGRWLASHEAFATVLWDLVAYPPAARRLKVDALRASLQFSAADRWLVAIEPAWVTLRRVGELDKEVSIEAADAALERGGARLCGLRQRQIVTWDLQVDDPTASPTVLGDIGDSPIGEIACAAGRVAVRGVDAIQIFDRPGAKPRRASDPDPEGLSHVVLSPNGRYLASWSSHTPHLAAIRVWDLSTATPRPMMKAPGGRLVHVDVSDEGVIALRDDNQQVRWSFDAQREAMAWPGLPIFAGQQIWGGFSPWDPAPGGWLVVQRDLELVSLHVTGLVDSIAFSPDGRFIATHDDTGVRVWDLSAQHPGAADSLLLQDRLGHDVAHSHDLSWVFDISKEEIVLAHGQPGTTPRRAGSTSLQLDQIHEVNLAFSKDDRFAVTRVAERGGRGRSLLWALDETAREIIPVAFDGKHGAARQLELSPNGRYLAVLPDASSNVRLRSLGPGGVERELGSAGGGLAQLLFSPDETWLVAGTAAGALFVWSLAGGESEPRKIDCPKPAQTFGFSPDGRFLLVQNEGNALCLITMRDLRVHALADSESVVAWSPDGATLVARRLGAKALDLWDLRDGEPSPGRRIPSRGDAVFSPDGRWLVVTRPPFGYDTALLFDLRSGTDPHELQVSEDAHARVFSADGRWLASVDERRVLLWRVDGAAPAEAVTIAVSRHAKEGCLAFRADSAQLAVNAGEGTVLVGLSNRGVEHSVTIGAASQRGCAYARDGKYLVTVPEDWNVQVWASDRAALEEAAHRVVGRNLTPEEWRDAFGTEPYRKTFPDLP